MGRKSFDTDLTEFREAIGLLVRRARVAASNHELSWTETGVLRRLGKDGPTTTADLARAEGMRPQSMRSIIATLEKMGLVARQPHPTDGRQVNIGLTAKGKTEEKNVGDAKRVWMAHAFSNLEEQERETLFAAGKIIKRLIAEDQQ